MEQAPKTNEVFQKFLRYMEVRNYSPESIRTYAFCLKQFFIYLKGKGIEDFKKVGREELKAYDEALRAKYSLQYIGTNIRAIKCFFKYLKKTNVILYDFAVTLKQPKVSLEFPQAPMTLSEVKALLGAPDLRTELGIRDRAIMETFYSTGIRVQEMSNLTLLDLDLEKGFLFVRQGKGQKDRTVPLGRHACFFIETYLDGPRGFFVSKNKKPLAVKTNRVWISRRGKALGKLLIERMFRVYRNKAGIEKPVTPHSFRRTLAVELIRNQCDFLAVKGILGHARSETTLRYCALSGVDLQDAMKKSHPRHEVEEFEDATPRIKSIGYEE